MPGDTIYIETVSARGELYRPASVVSSWNTVITAGGPAAQDAATITNAATQITAATRLPLNIAGAGTHLLLILGYDDALTTITSPVVKVFGKTGTDPYHVLKSRGGLISVTLPCVPATDDTDGTLLYTASDFDALAWDLSGCNEIIVGVETALAGTGTVANSIIQAKVI